MSLEQIKYIKISPGIGMARVGNSDTDFIGPETPGIPPNPSGGFKDGQGKVKPMSARFRVYGYNLQGEAIMELNLDTPGVTALDWTVHMVNKKAANYAFQGKFGFKTSDLRNPTVQPHLPPDKRDKLIIDPGMVMISGKSTPRTPLTDTIFDGITDQTTIPLSNILGHYGERGSMDVTYAPTTVTIGWLKTDDSGRLVIVGGRGEAASATSIQTVIQKGPGYYNGTEPKDQRLNSDPNSNGNLYFNNPGWYDDTAGGSVNVSVTFTINDVPVTFNSTDAQTFEGGITIEEKNKRAWIAVAPPKFAPSMANVVSLADLQYNIFPEKAPGAGSLFAATLSTSAGYLNLYDSKTGSSYENGPIAQLPNPPQFSPALVTFNQTVGSEIQSDLYCAYNAGGVGVSGSIHLAISSNPLASTPTYSYYNQTADVQSDVGPDLTVFNGKVYCTVVANRNSSAEFKNKVVLGSTTGDTLTFNALSFKLATAAGLEDFTDLPTQPVAISAYNGQLYLAMSVNGTSYLGVPSTSVSYQFNMQKVGQDDIVNNLSPSITAFDDRLYYAITDSTNVVQYGSLDLNGPQIPLNTIDPNDTTPAFNIAFQPVDEAVSSNLAPAISGFNGKLYCLAVHNPGGGTSPTGYLYTKTPLVHANVSGKAVEQEPEFVPAGATFESGNAQPALAVYETVDFYRDILPTLQTVTDYAYVNELAFDGHGPKTQANFVRSTYETSLGAPDTTNSGTRKHVFQFIRPGEWITEVPPPPKDFPNSITGGDSIVPPQENQQGTLMPHLAGTGGSVDENIFNNTQYPGQWLSLTRLQLDKFQKWVNGQFATGNPIPAPTDVDSLDVDKRPDALDLAALELTVGGGFHPGIELTYYMAYPEYFCEPFRFTDHIKYNGDPILNGEVTPGSIAGYMSIPWHGDFWSCNVDFWPPQRPDIVVQDVEGVPTTVNWFRSEALNIPETASSDTKWLHGENPEHFDGNHTTYQTFLRYWSYFGFVTVDPGNTDEQEQVRIETERDDCLNGSAPPTCPPVNPGLTGVTPVASKKALTVEDDRYTLKGKVLKDSSAVQGLHIEAYDHDLLSKDDKLGGATTDANGMFSIQFSQADFSRFGLEKFPDVYFKVFKGTDLILTTKDKVIKSLDDLQDLININLP